MGWYLQIDTEEEQPLATLSGWRDVRAWVEGLPLALYPCLHHYLNFGWEDDLADFEAQIQAALQNAAPDSPDTRKIIENLLAELQARPKNAAVITITDGMEPDTEDEDVESDLED